MATETAEQQRLAQAREQRVPWKKWGPYLSERQWGTVREDYSKDGNAWDYFSHDQARSRAYRWGEDGIAGISDFKQQLCFALCLWNGKDPILKERLFGLTNSEGNHGEDVKEYYFYLDSTPTHSYMKMLYKYPQKAYPYDEIVARNRGRSRVEPEVELLDTGVFAENRYFDVFVEYAKAEPNDVAIVITALNRGPEAAELHLLPTLWFRNVWSWSATTQKPSLKGCSPGRIAVHHEGLGEMEWAAENAGQILFTENETNTQKLFETPNNTPYVKDAFHDFLIYKNKKAINPENIGTKAAAFYRQVLKPGESWSVRLRLRPVGASDPFDKSFNETLAARRQEADAFYQSVIPAAASVEVRRMMRQAWSGMLWSKQYYYFDVNQWLAEHGTDSLKDVPAGAARNRDWHHMVNDDIISMPDKWEYPWYAAWDLAFHAVTLSSVDSDFAKDQLDLMLREMYLHPNGQIPAYEWNFGDVNPPVHAWATHFIYRLDEARRGKGDLQFLRRSFHKLLLNFTWWINRKDRNGRNVFEGGFLGLDNIGVFDRSSPLPTGGFLEQADGTAWMALYTQCMLEIALELAYDDPIYEDMALKFIEHFIMISTAMNLVGSDGQGMWDDADGFFYDVLRLPDGSSTRLKVRSMVGLLPLCAVNVFPGRLDEKFPYLSQRAVQRMNRVPALQGVMKTFRTPGVDGRQLMSILDESRIPRVLARLLDEKEFLSPYGIRSLSIFHQDNPYVYRVGRQEYRVSYMPGESDNAMFGGNSNWRGPIWMPVNILLIRALLNLYSYYGDQFKIECPTGSSRMLTLYEAAREIVNRLGAIFKPDSQGRRPVNGDNAAWRDPNWRDNLLFYEYFHADTGAGLGASHQTGWTGLIAPLFELFTKLQAEAILEKGKSAIFAQK